MPNDKTEDIDLIVNHPKKAINKLAFPIIISYISLMLNNIIDGIWVSGLGPDPLAAVGFVTPVFLAFVGFSNGLGAGANSLIARYIGAEEYENAGNSAIHAIVLSIVVTIISTVLILIILKPLLLIMGAGEVLEDTLVYGRIVIGGIFSVFLPAMMAAIFRAQGDVKRASYPLILNALINIVLDPIFIYVLGWGIGGAAFATVLSGTLAALPMVYWMFIKRDGFLKIKMSEYKRNLQIYKDILVVGIPASLEQFIISFVSILFNYWITILGGTVAVASYTATWRLVSIGMSPIIGVGIAALTVAGAAYGARNLVNLKAALNYGVSLGLLSSMIISSFFFIFADPVSFIFSYSANSAVLSSNIVEALRILCFFILFMPFGVLAGYIFQAMGNGAMALFLTILRSFIMEVIFAGLFAFVLGFGLIGLYVGLVFGMSTGSLIGYVHVRVYLKLHEDYFKIV